MVLDLLVYGSSLAVQYVVWIDAFGAISCGHSAVVQREACGRKKERWCAGWTAVEVAGDFFQTLGWVPDGVVGQASGFVENSRWMPVRVTDDAGPTWVCQCVWRPGVAAVASQQMAMLSVWEGQKCES